MGQLKSVSLQANIWGLQTQTPWGSIIFSFIEFAYDHKFMPLSSIYGICSLRQWQFSLCTLVMSLFGIHAVFFYVQVRHLWI